MWKELLVTWFVSITTVVSCPHHCQCFIEEGLRTADCSGAALTTHQQLSQIDVLNVRPHYNGFRTRLSPRGFKNFKNIKFLNLSNTSISLIPDEVFYGLNYIITIDLSYNKIKHLNGGVFKELSTLQTLLLRGNPLLLTQSDVIVSKSLRKLDLGSCGLRNVPPVTFAYVTSLIALFLDGNSIQSFGYNSFPLGLGYLNLANNQIVNVATDVLHTMKHLTRIDMSGNPIRCSCQLLLLQDALSGQGRIFENDIVCSAPRQFYGQNLSQINENELCNLEFIKKERYMNSIKHYRDARSYRKHNMIKRPFDDHSFDIQGDQPQISEERDSEVMFSNPHTRNMGTHMAKSYTSHYRNPLDISDENNKLSAGKPSLSAGDSDPLSNEAEILSNEQEDSKLMYEEEGADDIVNTVDSGNSNKTDDHFIDHESMEDLNDNESLPLMEQVLSSTEHSEKFSDSNLDEMNPEETLTASSHIKEASDNTSFATSMNRSEDYDNLSEYKEDFSDVSEPSSILHDDEVKVTIDGQASSYHHEITDLSKTTNDTEEISLLSSEEDVEQLPGHLYNHTGEPLARYSHLQQDNLTSEFDDTSMSSIDDIFESDTFTTTSPKIEPYTWPTSKTDMTDYNYDAQHDDYSSVEPFTRNVNSTNHPQLLLTTELYTSWQEKMFTTDQPQISSRNNSFELEEGSGDSSDETIGGTERTIPWLEEQENETTTEDYGVENVLNLFNITSFPEAELSHYVAENASSSDSTITDNFTSEYVEFTSVSNKYSELSSITESSIVAESTTEEVITSSEAVSGDSTSLEILTSEVSTTSPFVYETQTVSDEVEVEKDNTDFPTENTTSGTSTDMTGTFSSGEVNSTKSSTVSDVSSSSSYSSPEEVTSESIAESNETSEESITKISEISTNSSSSLSPILAPEENEEKRDQVSSISTSEQPSEFSSSVKAIDSDVSSTPVSEVEFVSKSVDLDDKENIIVDPSKEGISEEEDEAPDISMIGIIIVILLLFLVIVLISMAVVCRRTKRPKNKVRLPVDAEANLGTEMQDMLLPKPPENGVKVVPKNYTNGTTGANGNKLEQKDEETPVLAAEPEQPVQDPDWEEKPEPIETVTARLSMLARPQTPVFIPKTLN